MKQVSENYTVLRGQTGFYYDVKVVRGSGQSTVEYGMDRLKSIKIDQSLFNESGPQIAGVFASQCTLKLIEQSANWPRMADFEVLVRASSADGEIKSSWLSMGKYYTDTRKADKYGNLTITAYDGMLLLEQTWAEKVTLPQSWPITARAMANLIVSATGVQIDARSVLDDTTAYIGLDTRSTAREMLSVIAAGMGGNWTMTVDGKLLLVGLRNGGASGDGLLLEDGTGNVWRIPSGAGRANDITLADLGGSTWHLPVGSADVGEIPVDGSDGGTWHIPMIGSSQKDTDAINLGLSIVSFEANTELPPVHTVEFVSDSGTQARSTDEVDGYTLLAHCNFASTNIANLCLEKTRGYCYKPFSSTGARLDPAAELGDFVQIDNEIFPIISITWRLGKHIVADISAPFEEDVDHEYPMLSENQKTLQKAIGAAADSREYVDTRLEGVESELSVLSGSITAKVDKVHQGEHTAFSWELTDQHHNWYTVDAGGSETLVMSVTGAGLKVVGEIIANSGVIGIDGDAFSIVPRHTETVLDPESGEYVQVTYPSSIQNGIATFDDNQHDGVYIGTDGIRLGRYFTVNKRGELTAKSGVIGGFTISQNALYSGGASSYSGTGDGVHLSASGIRLGDNFKVSNSGVVNASGLNMTGGTINLTRVVQDEETGQDITETVFYVSSGGSVNANFTGGTFKIGDKMVLSGNSLTLGGFNIGANSISSTVEDEDGGVFGVNISPYGISLSNSDGSVFNVDSSGNASFGGTIFAENISGAVTQEQLAQAVQTTLSYATAYNNATKINPSSHPEQFTATAFYAVQNDSNVGGFVNAQRYMTIAAPKWGYGPEMENSVVPTAAHWHTFTEGTGANAGKIFIGQAIPATSDYADRHFFDIADTQFYRDGVSAARQSVLRSVTIDRTYDEITGEVNGAYTFNGHEYVDVALMSDSKRFTTKRLNVDDLTSGEIESTGVTRDSSHYDPYQDYISGSVKWVIDTKAIINGTAQADVTKLDVQDLYNRWHTEQISVQRISAVRETADANIVWDAVDQTVSADYTLRAWDAVSGGNVLYTEDEYPITIPANKAYNAGVTDGSDAAEANYISYVPTYPTEWNPVIALPGSVISSGNHKYVQADFDLTAGHQISGSQSTAFDYDSDNRIFNVDVSGVWNEAFLAGKSYATPVSIARRINSATGQEIPDTWDDRAAKGAIYLRAGNATQDVYYDATIEVDTDSAIYQAGYDAGGGGICPVMGIESMLYASITGANAYSQITVTFTDDSTGTYSLPLVYNQYASENETLYNYARYIGGRSPAITNRRVSPTIYDTENPYVLPVEVEFNTNGNAQSFETTVDVYAVYEEGRRAGGGGISPAMEISSVDEHSYSSTADFTLTFDNSYLRYDSANDLLQGRILATMADGNTQTVFVRMDAQRKSLTPPSYTVTNGNVEEDQNNPYDPTNPYVFNVVATFSVDGNNRSYTSFVNVFDVYQAGVAEGESSGADYSKGNESLSIDEESYDSGFYIDGTNSRVAVTGYVDVDNHRINLDSHDIGVGSVWWAGRNSKNVDHVVNYAGEIHTGPYGSKTMDLTSRVYFEDGNYEDFQSEVNYYE